MAEVTFKDVDKVYPGDVQAVKDLSLEILDGEFLVLVGPSGCGKTTALRMVAGLEEISDGTISIGGRVVNELTPKERDIAMVFQNYALYPHMSVAENIAFGLRLRKAPKEEIERRVEWAAKMLDLAPYLARRPKELSGGQRQRVAMGRAIVREPQAFLMDEPLSNLDAKLRVQMRADIARLQDELGTTTIYVTHDQVEAMTMGDRVAVMSLGELQQVDVPQRLYDQPANLFVAGFIGTPPMNLIQAQVQSQNGSVVLTVGPQSLLLSDQTLSHYSGHPGRRREDHRARRALGGSLPGGEPARLADHNREPRAARGARLRDRRAPEGRRRGHARARGALGRGARGGRGRRGRDRHPAEPRRQVLGARRARDDAARPHPDRGRRLQRARLRRGEWCAAALASPLS